MARRGRQRTANQTANTHPQFGRSYGQLTMPFPPIEILSKEGVEKIHQTGLTILKEVGLKVLHAKARQLYKQAGALVDDSTQMVRFDPDMVMEHLAKAPSEISLYGATPQRHVKVGGNQFIFCGVAGPPHITDLEKGRRAGTLEDFENFIRILQAFDIIHVQSIPVEPQDLPIVERQMAMTYAVLTLSDKPMGIYARGHQHSIDSLEMLRLARGVDEEAFRQQPYCFTVVNMNSPLQLDVPMAQGIIDFAHYGQICIVTPFTLAGAMAPITIAGALAQSHAEALAGLTLSQIVNPGTPVIYGSFTSNVDMKTGSPAFGTPEYVKACYAAGQLARRINLPWRSSNVNASNAPDAQAAYESMMSLQGVLGGGSQFILHGAGWLEGGLSASFEKAILDMEMLQMQAEVLTGLPVDDDSLGLEAVKEVGPGGHFFGATHTMSRYKDTFYEPLVSDWSNFETWTEKGSLTATDRAHQIYKNVLERFVPPTMPSKQKQALDAFYQQRLTELRSKPFHDPTWG